MKKQAIVLTLALAFAASAVWARRSRGPSWNDYPPPPPSQGQGYWYSQPPPPPPPTSHGGWNDGHRPAPPHGDWRDGHHSGHSHGGWHGHHNYNGHSLVGEFSAAGGAKEVSIGGGKSSVFIEITSGVVSFNTIVLRRGSQKQSVTVATRFNAGERYTVPVDPSVTGLRISCSGNGRFRVYAR